MLNFSENELKLYIKHCRPSEDNKSLEDYYQYTNLNPYLVSVFASVERDRLTRTANVYMAEHVNSILRDMDTFEQLHTFCTNEFQNFYYWGCVAENKIIIDKDELTKFKESWAAIEHFLFYVKVDAFRFRLQCAMFKYVY